MKHLSLVLALVFSVVTTNAQDSLVLVRHSIVADSSFNKGNIHSPYQLIHGKVTGVLISRPGADPNKAFDVRVRGISTVTGNIEPLVVIDGMPADNILSIDPNDIERIEILKGPESARWGMQGASGVMLITTKRNSNRPFWLSYHAYASMERKIQKQFVLSTDEFLANGGNDIGGRTNWIEEITQNAYGSNHHLALGKAAGVFNLHGSFNYRTFNGIQRETGFKRLNGLFGVDTRLLNDNLIIRYTGSIADEKAELGFDNAFKQAVQLFPTLPVMLETGIYAEPNQFDEYNAVAMIRENMNERTRFAHLHALSARLKMGNFYFDAFSGLTRSELENREVYGNSLAAYRSGELFEASRETSRARTRAEVGSFWALSSVNLEAKLGADHQRSNRTFHLLNANPQFGTRTQRGEMPVNLMAYTLDVTLRAKRFYIDLYNRIERSSALAAGHNRGHFYSVKAAYDLSSLLSSNSQWLIEAGFGRSGLTPFDSLRTYMGTLSTNLTYERSDHTDLSSHYTSRSGKWSVSVTRYQKKISDIIFPIRTPDFRQRYENRSILYNRGWEIELKALVIKKDAFDFSTGLNFTSLKTKWEQLPDPILKSGTTGPGFGSTNFVAHIEGEPYGQLYGYIVTGIQQNQWEVADLNNDGWIGYEDDQTSIGQALPSHWIGWTNSFRYNRFSLSFLWRGVFGHSLANVSALHFRINNNVNWNTLKTTKPLADGNVWSNEFAEKASYARLDYMSLDYLFPLSTNGKIKSIRLYVAGNNLVTFSKYSGNDPDVRLTDYGEQLAGGRPSMFPYDNSPSYTPGIDRSSTWLPARTYVLGVNISF
ncbi:MAG TPA: TonB-dependent receptor plug domain-containing protein [Chryseosolibacter sp.]